MRRARWNIHVRTGGHVRRPALHVEVHSPRLHHQLFGRCMKMPRNAVSGRKVEVDVGRSRRGIAMHHLHLATGWKDVGQRHPLTFGGCPDVRHFCGRFRLVRRLRGKRDENGKEHETRRGTSHLSPPLIAAAFYPARSGRLHFYQR